MRSATGSYAERRQCARSPSPLSSLSVTPRYRMDVPGSRVLLRPGGLGRGGRLRRGVPGHGRLPGSGPLDDPGLVPISGPESRSRTPAHPDRPGQDSRRSPSARLLATGFAARMTDPCGMQLRASSGKRRWARDRTGG